MQIYVVGNLLVERDNLVLRLLPKLRMIFPRVKFVEVDPNENFLPDIKLPLYLLDVVVGIKKIMIFPSLDEFAVSHPVSAHDYDLLFHLRLLNKLGRLPQQLQLIGIPAGWDESRTLAALRNVLSATLS